MLGQRGAVGVGMYLLAAFLFGLNGVLAKGVIGAGVDPGHFAQLRNTVAAVLLVAYLLAARRSAFRITWRDLPFLAAYGAIAFTIVQFFYFVAISRLPVGLATLIGFTAPLFVALWIRFARKTPVSSLIWVALALVLGGLATVAEVWAPMRFDVVGIAAGFGAAVSLTLYWLLGESGGSSRDALSLTMWGFAFAAVIWAVILPVWGFPWTEVLASETQPLGDSGPTMPVWPLALWCGVMGGLVPYVLALASVHRIGSQRAGIAATTEPIWAAVLAMLMIGEVLTWWQGVGGIVVLVGVLVAEYSSRQTVRPPTRRPAQSPSGS